MFKVGTEFRYRVAKTVGGRPEGIPFEEVYRIVSVDGDSVRVEKSSDEEETQMFETETSYASYVFRTDGFRVVSKSPIQVELEGSLVYVDAMSPGGLCGGSITTYVGRDGIAYRDERTQMWSGGVIYKESRRLLSITVDGRVYEDIKWVDEGECSDTEDDE